MNVLSFPSFQDFPDIFPVTWALPDLENFCSERCNRGCNVESFPAFSLTLSIQKVFCHYQDASLGLGNTDLGERGSEKKKVFWDVARKKVLRNWEKRILENLQDDANRNAKDLNKNSSVGYVLIARCLREALFKLFWDYLCHWVRFLGQDDSVRVDLLSFSLSTLLWGWWIQINLSYYTVLPLPEPNWLLKLISRSPRVIVDTGLLVWLWSPALGKTSLPLSTSSILRLFPYRALGDS